MLQFKQNHLLCMHSKGKYLKFPSREGRGCVLQRDIHTIQHSVETRPLLLHIPTPPFQEDDYYCLIVPVCKNKTQGTDRDNKPQICDCHYQSGAQFD